MTTSVWSPRAARRPSGRRVTNSKSSVAVAASNARRVGVPFTRVGYGRASAARTEALRLGDLRGSLLSATTRPLYDQYSHGTSRALKSFSVWLRAAGARL